MQRSKSFRDLRFLVQFWRQATLSFAWLAQSTQDPENWLDWSMIAICELKGRQRQSAQPCACACALVFSVLDQALGMMEAKQQNSFTFQQTHFFSQSSSSKNKNLNILGEDYSAIRKNVDKSRSNSPII